MKITFKNDEGETVEAWSDYYDGVADTWEIVQVPRRGDEVHLWTPVKRTNMVATVRKVAWLSPTEVVCHVE